MSKDSHSYIVIEDDSDAWQAQLQLEEQRRKEKVTPLPRHGSPEDRGSADKYYGRAYDPHYYVGDSYSSERVEGARLTVEDCRLYIKGWNEQTDLKDWG